jgi:hypothetical protein
MYVYAIGSIFFLAVWLIIYIFVPKSRGAILWSSIAWGHAGPISEYWHLKDYWNPVYMRRFEVGNWSFGVEDYFFAFAYGGLAAGIFDILARKSGEIELKQFYLGGFIKLLLVVIFCLFIMGVMTALLNFNSLHAISITLFAGGTIIIILRPRWTLAAIQTGIISGIFMWRFYWGFYLELFPHVVDNWWYQAALTGISVGGVPIEELIWASTAFFVGPVFRYCLTTKT